MELTTKIPLEFVEIPGGRMLVGQTDANVKRGSCLVLRKIAGQYELCIVESLEQPRDPEALASFVLPEDVDATKAVHAACLAKSDKVTREQVPYATPKSRRSTTRKPKARKEPSQ